MHFLGGPNSNPLTQWQEEAIPVQVLATAYPNGIIPLLLPIRCLLGKHAIARLIQRSGHFDARDVRNIDFCALNSEIAPLTSWSAVWTILLAEALRSPGLQRSELMVPIPTQSGVFMATICSDHPLLNVRTFLCDQQLSERQLALKDRLVRAMSADEHALIECCAPELQVPDASFALSMVLSRVARISQDWLGPLMTRIACRDDRRKLATSIAATLAVFTLDDSMHTLYERVGLSAVSAALRKPDANAALMRLLASEAKKMRPTLNPHIEVEA
ncbi:MULTISPECIES: hypothetical protein [unclassified Caballeronia]|uniref:hypothetical protein n=1 Tax=unclassified Caballeronia TaxID=2646786 RepID=UPI00285B2FED|nr:MULTISPECIES: hypothetical protein [unclassified Caballeronia]MDR5751323.1 hypothetical protein [Caballeronia sp. LZ024]MDR5844535.1 hypothetical protein [Caballeronia sp. LZ031]